VLGIFCWTHSLERTGKESSTRRTSRSSQARATAMLLNLRAALGLNFPVAIVRHFAIRPPPTRGIKIFCGGCRAFLYSYKKGGKGKLVKCFVERIVQDATAGDMHCHKCGQQFARLAKIKGVAAHKIIGKLCCILHCC
jgi:hypothetical protein